jgi:hypothetical protein
VTEYRLGIVLESSPTLLQPRALSTPTFFGTKHIRAVTATDENAQTANGIGGSINMASLALYQSKGR